MKKLPNISAAIKSLIFVCPQGWFSPGQVFVLDEYCARYGVRGCHRHLSYLKDLMDYSENNALVDPTLLHYSYAFCASHVHGNRYDDGAQVVVVSVGGKPVRDLILSSHTDVPVGNISFVH